MANYLITGASRGIGLELTKQLLELPASQVGKVFALTRSDLSAPLSEIINHSQGRAFHVKASVDDSKSVEGAANEVKAKLGGHGLDVLVNNAGMQAYAPGGTRTVQPEQLADMFNVNVIGPQRVTQAFLPLLEAGKQKKVINISSTMGSVAWAERFTMAPTQSYKICKAALHMLNKQYALDFADAGFIFLLASPGWLKTKIGGEYADFDVDVGVKELRRIIIEADRSQNGKFLNIHVPGQEKTAQQYDGGEVPW